MFLIISGETSFPIGGRSPQVIENAVAVVPGGASEFFPRCEAHDVSFVWWKNGLALRASKIEEL